MIARIVKWWRGFRKRQREQREMLDIIAGMRKRGHFAPYTVTVGTQLVQPKTRKKKRTPKYVEWRAVFKNGRPYRRLLVCPYCGGRAKLGVRHPCQRAKKTFVIHRPGYYETIA